MQSQVPVSCVCVESECQRWMEATEEVGPPIPHQTTEIFILHSFSVPVMSHVWEGHVLVNPCGSTGRGLSGMCGGLGKIDPLTPQVIVNVLPAQFKLSLGPACDFSHSLTNPQFELSLESALAAAQGKTCRIFLDYQHLSPRNAHFRNNLWLQVACCGQGILCEACVLLLNMSLQAHQCQPCPQWSLCRGWPIGTGT